MPETVNIYNNTGEGFKTSNPYLNAVNNIKNGQNTIRKDNCYTPFRMPLRQNRKLGSFLRTLDENTLNDLNSMGVVRSEEVSDIRLERFKEQRGK